MTDICFRKDLQSLPWWWDDAPLIGAQPDHIPAESDVAIVGAGYTGLTAAITLARAGRSVLVLDAEKPGSGASTRNGGMIGSGHKVGLSALSKRFGQSIAIELLREGGNALSFTSGFIEQEKLDCHFQRCGRFRAAWNNQHFESMSKELELMQKHLGLDAEMMARADQHHEVNTEAYDGGCIFHQHGSLHPAKFHNELLKLATSLGVVILSGARVLRTEKENSRYRICTADRSFYAGDVILATNGYRDSAAPELCKRVVPVSSFIIATEPLEKELLKSLIPGGRMIVESRGRHCYYRLSPDGRRLLFGGRAALQPLSPHQSAAILYKLMVQLFPTLDGVRLTHSWTGNVAMSQDSMPHVGRLDSGEYFATAYNGSGIAMAPYLGYKLAHCMLGNPEGDTPLLRTPFPRIPLYSGRSWFLPLINFYYRQKDRVEGSL